VTDTYSALARSIREVAEYLDGQGWDLPSQMFALVPTAELAAAEPSLLDQLDSDQFTPVAQEPFPVDNEPWTPVEEFLATTRWPDTVAGCVLVQQILVLPPDAESDLDEAMVPLLADTAAADRAAVAAAGSHPDRRDARLYCAVLRDGPSLSLLQLRPDDDDPFPDLELLSYPNLAANLLDALRHTLEEDED
jgi:hypothetical protein